ncbi:MAG: hypothetical protein ABI651_05020, partial [Verrucomicrobiota bacterium]
MKVLTFTAKSAADAVAQIRDQLGPEAMVLNVRQLSTGFSRWWQKPQIEVLACLPESQTATDDSFLELRREIAELKQHLPIIGTAVSPANTSFENLDKYDPNTAGRWRCGSVLEQTGILPLHAQKVVEKLQNRHGENPPESLAEEFSLMRAVLSDLWQEKTPPPSGAASRLHVLVGAPGVGKTTVLCKWLTQSVLVEGRSASVWRLDGRTANTAEMLSVFGEILTVPVHRTWPVGDPLPDTEIVFVDLPGVDWSDPTAIDHLAKQLSLLPQSQIHLILNAAYEIPILFAQVRAFSSLPITDLSFTHLDEETRWGKLWNLVLGTNYSVRFLGAGQNVPG